MAGFASPYGFSLPAIDQAIQGREENSLRQMLLKKQSSQIDRDLGKQNALAQWLNPALGGDKNALAQVMAVDPETGLKVANYLKPPAGSKTNLEKFIAARDALPEGDPKRAYFDAAIAKETKPEGDSALSSKIGLMVEQGIPRDVATKIATGVYAVDRHPISGVAQIVDKATGNVIAGGASAAAPVTSNGGASAAAPVTSNGGASAAAPVTGGEPAPKPSLPTDVDYTEGTGPSGFIGWAANTVSDLMGGKLAAPEAERAAQGLTNLQIRTQTGLQSAIPGRPSNYLMQRLDKLAVQPNSLMTGDRRAFERLRQTRDMLREEVQRMDRDILKNSSGFTPQQVAETRANKSQIDSILRDYDVVVGSFEKAIGGQGGPKLSPDVEALIQKYKGQQTP